MVSDTVLHIGGYAGLVLLTLRATAGGRWAGVTARAMTVAFLIALVHGLSVEVEQMFVPSRFAEWRDVGNDVIGALAGLVAAWAWGKLFKA
jgi:VanZ family protein